MVDVAIGHDCQAYMIAKPTTVNYELGNFLSRAVIKIECQTESDWVKFLDKKSRIGPYLPCWVVEGNFLQGRQTLETIQI